MTRARSQPRYTRGQPATFNSQATSRRAGFGPIGMEQLWNRGVANVRALKRAKMGWVSDKPLPPGATGCRLDRMVSRALAVGCHPLREVPSLRRRGAESRPLGRLVRRAGGPRESLLHHYAMSAIRARVCTCLVRQDAERRTARAGLARARSRTRESSVWFRVRTREQARES